MGSVRQLRQVHAHFPDRVETIPADARNGQGTEFGSSFLHGGFREELAVLERFAGADFLS